MVSEVSITLKLSLFIAFEITSNTLTVKRLLLKKYKLIIVYLKQHDKLI
jgi:hypothetical protein